MGLWTYPIYFPFSVAEVGIFPFSPTVDPVSRVLFVLCPVFSLLYVVFPAWSQARTEDRVTEMVGGVPILAVRWSRPFPPQKTVLPDWKCLLSGFSTSDLWIFLVFEFSLGSSCAVKRRLPFCIPVQCDPVSFCFSDGSVFSSPSFHWSHSAAHIAKLV